jgi:glucose-6-phosphate-specific signal transduction histidine kinase
MNAGDQIDRLSLVLGRAVIAAWSDLPQNVQHDLFERAVMAGHAKERDESLREELAQFLHDHHKRTAGT